MKRFQSIRFDKDQCRNELAELKHLLDSKPDLSERSELQPFFANHLISRLSSAVTFRISAMPPKMRSNFP